MSAKSNEINVLTLADEDNIIFTPPEPIEADTICNICLAEFIDPDDLQIHKHHIHNIISNSKRSCQFCSAPYTDLMAYGVHIRDDHLLTLKCCKYCCKIFNDFDAHRKHEKKHLKSFNNGLYNCSQCNYTFGNIYEMQNHEEKEHNNNVDGIILECLQYLSAALKVKAIPFIKHLCTYSVFTCKGCNYSTNEANSYIRHAQSNKCTIYICEKCSSTYSKKINLQRHVERQCNPKQPTTKVCAECGKSFSRIGYKSHKKNCNSIKCYICNIQFLTMYELSEHQAKEHPLSVELKTCKYCRKQLVGTVALQKHMDRSHKGEFHLYKYLCIDCNSVYKHPQKLFSHFFTRHRDLNPYTCKICNLEFRPRKKFTIHIKLEHDGKGFIEFDKNYHVFFTDIKSEYPFVPKSIFNKYGNLRDSNDETENTDNIETDNEVEKLNNNMQLVNENTDCISYTETEGNQTEIETKTIVQKQKRKSKRAIKIKKFEDEDPSFLESSDDEPLLTLKDQSQTVTSKLKLSNKNKLTKINKQKFTCNICNRYCYTYQNYNHHISLHSKHEAKKCIKCSKVFKSKSKLAKHVAVSHSTSKLTETLKSLLEKRKSGVSTGLTELSMSEKFRRTIKKVNSDKVATAVKVTVIGVDENGTYESVENFVQNYLPDENKNEPFVNSSVSIKLVEGPFQEPMIKMTKFEPKALPLSTKLSKPVKFKDCFTDKATVSIKLVEQPEDFYEINMETSDHYYEDMDRSESIPEVAEEVMLEEAAESPKKVKLPHKIIIDKLPSEYKDIRIAHLLPEAPYFKIVNVKEVLKPDNKTKEIKPNTIKLPDGTKLVTSNPLAHLLGNTPVEEVMKPIKNKYYKPKPKNYQDMLAEALSKLDNMPKTKKAVKD